MLANVLILGMMIQAGVSEGSTLPWECRSTTAVSPSLPVEQQFGSGVREYQTAGANLFGFPTLWLRHDVREETSLNARSIAYRAVIDGNIAAIRSRLLEVNPDLECRPAGVNFWCSPRGNPDYYGSRSVFLGVARATARMEQYGDSIVLVCEWQERLR